MPDILIIASGGGHTGFARSIAEYLPEKVDFVIPKEDEISRKMIKEYANKIYQIEKFRSPSNGFEFSSFLLSIFHSIEIRKYKKVIATGSNHSIFPSFFQFLKGSEIFTIESQDRIITKGKAVNIISKYSKKVFLHWDEQKHLYRNGVVVGPIVGKPKYEIKDEGFIFVTTGSEGFERLFNKINDLGLKNVILQTGKVNPEKYKCCNAFSFDPDIDKYLSSASIVITHQGKTAMESVVLYKKPTIIVYNKDWKNATTYEDAKNYAKILGAKFLDDPSDWVSNEEFLKALEKPVMPREYTIGTPNLVKEILND
ncbi:UDP-N-acetylglucosamine--N-acetylmuramyl-(pentapeptide) pyrophosphoryl-undecaprenol N-acetylglucosamine transferase [Acidianus manzaensis]|uniref:Polysaccharide biosynthesis protein n=1 Tax=Acidianus manzaensis TaxID=282676 RepID=A0A1W6K2H5_9CREN|nr:glycosyltransferase [Acidianus manzaensis]ARM76644.1 polysaccharide biosynthesis protein [Acidianus manzaensis]